MQILTSRLVGRTPALASVLAGPCPIKHCQLALSKHASLGKLTTKSAGQLSFSTTTRLRQSPPGPTGETGSHPPPIKPLLDSVPKRVETEVQTPVPAPVSTPGGVPGMGLALPSDDTLKAALSTCVALAMVVIGGVAYVEWYKSNVLKKIEKAFAPGYDPALTLADHKHGKRKRDQADPDDDWAFHMRRSEQELVDKIVHGEDHGHYFLFLGSKGTGKTTMILDAMRENEAEGVAICEAHSDLEVFRLRLGKALNYEYHEDSQTGLFQRRDPREGGPRLDIERALNKLEKVALDMHEKRQKPLVLIFNNVHLFQNAEDAQLLLLQLQQRAETWAESGIITVVFSSDDFWPYPLLRKNGNRMQILSISDLNAQEALSALKRLRKDRHKDVEPDSVLKEVLATIGGRLSFISRTSRAKDIILATKQLLENDKAWLLSQVGLISDCDDDVMDEQKVSSCTWLLLREFAKLRRKLEAEYQEAGLPDVPMPRIPYWRCRQIMTRADFIDFLDHQNIIAIDINHNVTMDSMVLLKAVMEVVEEEGFDDMLESVRDRIDAIESLHRTRELTWKDSPEGDKVRIVLEKPT